MGEKIYRISESKLVELVDVLTKQRMDEATNAAPAREAGIKYVTKDIPGAELYATGKADVNTNSKGFKEVADALVNISLNKNIKKPVTVRVQGGASAAGGTPESNKKLADNRRDNMIIALTQNVSNRLTNELNVTAGMGFSEADYFKFERLDSIVGNATKLNSPEALAQQFVKVTYPVATTAGVNATTAIDKTATQIPNKGGVVGTGGVKNKLLSVEALLKTKDTGKTVLLSPDLIDSLNRVLGKHGFFFGDSSKMRPKSKGVS